MKVKKTIIEKRDISVVIPTEIIAEAKKFGRYGGHVIVPNKWVGKMVKLILMTAVMLSLFTSAAILTTMNSSGNNVAFAKKAATTTTATKDTGTTTKTTHTVDTGTSKTPSKDTGGSGSSSGSGSGSGSSSTSTSNSDSGTTKTNNGNGQSVDNSARVLFPPGYTPDTGTPDKVCAPGTHKDSVTNRCVNDGSPHNGLHGCGRLDVVDCHCPTNAMCAPHPKVNICRANGAVSCCGTIIHTGVSTAKCPTPTPTPTPTPGNSAYMKKYIAGWNQSCSDDMKETLYHKTGPHSKAWSDGYFDARQGDGPCPY